MAQNYVLLERIELNASAASVTFSNIPQSGYTDLKIVGSIRDATGGAGAYLYLRFNGDTGSNYSTRTIEGNGASAASYANTSQNKMLLWNTNGGGSTANTFANSELYVPNYLLSNQKSISFDTVAETNATTQYMDLVAGIWTGTAAINSVTFLPDSAFAANSTFSLYGLAAVGTTPAIAPKASGGNIDYDGTYFIHTFLSTGTFTPFTGLTCDYLVVAGGGGGGTNNSGGGGAGGFRTNTGLSVTAQSYTITVGAGGAGAPTATGDNGSSGSNSVFSTITSSGGGGGAGSGTVGVAGGSGGGGSGGFGAGSGGAGNAGSYSPVEGYAGGSGTQLGAPTYAAFGGGGGGSAAVGVNAVGGTSAGNGGAGTSNSYSGSALFYAAGGGGSASTGTQGTGGSSIGGNGANLLVNATNGTINTGSGGGSANNGGRDGGSGVVIIRYLAA
jgi:hypothetical protein